MKSSFLKADTDHLIARINQLTPETTPQWGKMNVSQMLAHCNVAYEMTYDKDQRKPNFLARFLLKTFVKPGVVGPKPYPKNSRTAPQFIITGERDFSKEKQRLIDYINQTQGLGAAHFEQKESPSFGTMTSKEWDILFAKHLDHHLTQFGA